MRVRRAYTDGSVWRRGLGLLRRQRPAATVPRGLHLNRIGDRPARQAIHVSPPITPVVARIAAARPAIKGRHVLGWTLRVGDRCWTWNWPIRVEVDR